MNMNTEQRPLAGIKPYDKNAKKHPTAQVEQIAASIKEFGFNQPIVIDAQGIIIVGHGRYEAAKALGLAMVPIVQVDLTEEQAKAYRLADNKLNESEWDMNLVIEELKGLSMNMIDLTGFDRDLILDTDDRDDDVPDVPVVPQSALGDIYQLGPHRLYVGDSTKKESYVVLMEGLKADMVFTDPPYNVAYAGTGKKTSEGIMNDNMDDEAFVRFLMDSFTAMGQYTKLTAGCYIFHSHKTASLFEHALKQSGFLIDTQLIWNKPSAGLGQNDYRTKHEPFFYASQGKEKTFYGDRTGTTVWKVPEDPKRALEWFKKQQALMEHGKSTIWTISRENVNEYVHPTQKPVELVVEALTRSSKAEDIVLDPFVGSGTTLIACQKANRNAYVIELDPQYADTTIQRYVNYTGNTNIRKNGESITWPMSVEHTTEDVVE